MAKINTTLEKRLQQAPEQPVELIVRTAGDVTSHLAWFASAGLSVKQQFRLTPGAAVSGCGRDALKLLDQPWVVSVELDAPVQAI